MKTIKNIFIAPIAIVLLFAIFIVTSVLVVLLIIASFIEPLRVFLLAVRGYIKDFSNKVIEKHRKEQ